MTAGQTLSLLTPSTLWLRCPVVRQNSIGERLSYTVTVLPCRGTRNPV
jgi:hypothetical protein